MKKRIYIYELDCYKAASEEQLQRMRISPERYFNLEVQIASQNGHLCHIRRPPWNLNGGQPRTH